MTRRRHHPLSRRTLLRGAGAAIALPFMESLALPALANNPSQRAKRLGVFYFPNGMRMEHFVPTSAGGGYQMPKILASLEAFRDHFSIVSGIAHYNAQPLGEPGGAHGRSCAAYLTGARAKSTEGSDLYCGVSMDQVAANHIGRETPFSSLELGIEPSTLLGSCDIGFSCTYTNTLSWRSPTQALPVTVNPRGVFESLFGDGATLNPAEREAQFQRKASILDFVLEDASRLSGRLGANDRRKLDEYMTSIRDVERRIQRIGAQPVDPSIADMTLPAGIPESFQDHARLMVDLQILAMQTELTRVSTFMLGRELSNRTHPEIGVPDSHHSLSHHGGNEEKIAKLVKISTYHMEQFSYYLQRLRDTPDADGSLLDSTLVLAGASLGEPNNHDCMDLPAIVAGGGVRGGQHLPQETGTPMCNLMLSMLHQLDVPLAAFGDSTQAVSGLFA